MENESLSMKEYLELNAKLQQKKNALRKSLKEKGILKKAGKNDYDNYKYFSEAQYKELFTELFSEHGLELNFTEISYEAFDGTGKQANGRLAKLEFSLIDVESGFSEETVITGEGMDKGDKAGYKAYTGALKYFLADKFMVATGDDAEKESPDHKMNTVVMSGRKASPKQIAVLQKAYTGENLAKLLSLNGVEKLEDISMEKASDIISKLKGGK
jgi:hypothetical protein